MAVPDFQSLMMPLLRLAREGQEHSLAEARDVLAAEFNGRRLTELMIDFDLAVNTSATYSVKRLDSDYFDETGAL